MFLMRFIVMPKRSVSRFAGKGASCRCTEIEDHLTDQKNAYLAAEEIPKALPKKRHCCRWVTLYPSVRR